MISLGNGKRTAFLGPALLAIALMLCLPATGNATDDGDSGVLLAAGEKDKKDDGKGKEKKPGKKGKALKPLMRAPGKASKPMAPKKRGMKPPRNLKKAAGAKGGLKPLGAPPVITQKDIPAPPPPTSTSTASASGTQTAAETGGMTTTVPDLGTPIDKKSKIYFDYEEAELLDILAEISEKLRINFIVEDKVKGGKVTIRCPNPITRHEAWLAFLSALELKGLSIVKVGQFYKIIRFKDAMKSPAPLYSEGQRIPKEERAVTYIYHLKYLAIKDAEAILKQLKSKDGDVVAFLPTNSFIITDSALNLHRMLRLLKQIDVPGQQDHIHIVEIFHADVTSLAEQINQIFGEKAKKGQNTTRAPHVKSPKGRKGKKAQKASAGTEEDAGGIPMITKVLPDERTNQLLIVCPDNTLKEVLGLIRELDVPIPGEGQVHIYYLENADAEETASTLANLAQGSSSRKGKKGGSKQAASLFEGEVKITADKATNSLVIVASLKDFKRLQKVIQKLDVRRRQVFVEAVIMEVTLSKNRNLGIALNGGATYDIGGDTIPIFGGTTFGTLSSIALDPTALQGLAVGLQGPDLEGTEGLILPGVSLPSFGVILQALQTDANANVLSTPHILTMDNEEAQIVVGSNVPFITGQTYGYNNTTPILQIQRQDVALTMKIKPQINESDFVRLTVEEEVTELVSISETLGPTTTKRAAKTVVVVKDGQTVVIGGLIKDKKTEDVSKIPFLGDIPIIGRLFRTTRTVNEKANLLIFLTPYIVVDDYDFQKIFKRKMRERAEFLRRFYGKDEEYEPPMDWDRKTGAVESIFGTIVSEEKDAESAAAGQTFYLHEGRKVRTLGGDDAEKVKDNSESGANLSETIEAPAPKKVKANVLETDEEMIDME